MPTPYRYPSKLILLFILLVLCCAVGARAQSDTLRVSDFGLHADTYTNCTSTFRTILDECRRRQARVLLLDEGRYDFWPEGAERRTIYISNTSSEQECPDAVKTIGLLVENQQGLTIDGQGATLMFHGKLTMLAIIHSSDVTLQNLHIDCERPGGSEMTVVSSDTDGTVLRFHPQSRYDIDRHGHLHLVGEGWQTVRPHCIEFDPVSDHFTYSGAWNTCVASAATEVEPGMVHFATPADFRAVPGHVLTVRDIIRDQVGILNLESRDVTFRDLQVHYMHGLGIISQYAHNVTMDHVDCMPREGSGRVLASSADFMHFSGCSGKVSVLGCRFSGAQDDPINVHGTNLRAISAEDDHTLRLRFMHGQTYGMDAFWVGDTVAFVHAATMQRYRQAVVRGVQRLTPREVLVTLDRPLPHDVIWDSDVVENLTRTPEVEIRGCLFTHTSTRGTLVTTPRRVVIADNTYLRTGMSAILIESDTKDWYESGPVTDVLIQGNRFIDCAYSGGPAQAVIAIHPSNTVMDPRQPVHQNIRILGNTFETWGNPVLYAKSTRNLVFQRNAVTGTPPASRFITEACSRVKLENDK